jgi:beta-glucosidase
MEYTNMTKTNYDMSARWNAAHSPVPIRKFGFASDFVFGASTSAYQIEGGVGEETGRGASIWEKYFADRPHLDHGAVACDHFSRMEEDVRMIKRMGLKAYRFSISWSRVLPLGKGKVNEQGLDFYSDLVDALLRNGIEPYVTLYHWDLPQALEDEGGWLNRDTCHSFADFAAVVAHRLGDRVKYFGTLNEPEVIVAGYIGEGLAPALQDPKLRVKVAHNLMLAHGLATQALRAIDPNFKIGVTLNLVPAEADNAANPKSVKAARQHWLKNYAIYLEAIFKGRYPDVVLDEMDATGAEVRPGDMAIISQRIDYLGVNWYLRHVVDENGGVIDVPGATKTLMGWEIHAPALTRMLVNMNKEYRLPPIFITENGAAMPDTFARGRVRDVGRMTYIHDHLAALESAVAAGVNIAGYFAWSLMDNLEWSLGFKMTFGIVHVDRNTLKRTVKDSGLWYRDTIKVNT